VSPGFLRHAAAQLLLIHPVLEATAWCRSIGASPSAVKAPDICHLQCHRGAEV
jgi:hypothetical protein